MRVLAIGRRPLTALTAVADLDLYEVAARTARAARADGGGDAVAVRCDGPAQLAEELERLGAARIERLDVFDHGAPGLQSLGDGELFASDASAASELIGREIAARIAPRLCDTAQVRLLGCNTGEGQAGRLLLLKLARALGGHRIVFGTIDRVIEGDFDRQGYAQVMEHQRLFSSIAALDMVAPDAARRFENMRGVREALIS